MGHSVGVLGAGWHSWAISFSMKLDCLGLWLRWTIREQKVKFHQHVSVHAHGARQALHFHLCILSLYPENGHSHSSRKNLQWMMYLTLLPLTYKKGDHSFHFWMGLVCILQDTSFHLLTVSTRERKMNRMFHPEWFEQLKSSFSIYCKAHAQPLTLHRQKEVALNPKRCGSNRRFYSCLK